MATVIERRNGLQEFADAATKGALAGQQMQSTALQQSMTGNQLAEYDRTQQRRAALSRVTPGDYKGIAAAEMEFGETGAASDALTKHRQTALDKAFQALQAQDLAAATQFANEAHGTNYTFAGLTPDKKSILLAAPDPSTPGRVRKLQPLPTSDFIAGLLGPEKGAAYLQKEREMQNASRNTAALSAAYRNNKDELVGLSPKNDSPVYKFGHGPQARLYTIGEGGRFTPYDERTMGRIKGLWNQKDAPPADPTRAAFVESIKRDPEVGYPMLQQYDMKQAALAKVAENRAKPPNVQAQELGQAAATLQNATPQARRQMLQQAVASGYDPAVAASIFDPRYAIPPAR